MGLMKWLFGEKLIGRKLLSLTFKLKDNGYSLNINKKGTMQTALMFWGKSFIFNLKYGIYIYDKEIVFETNSFKELESYCNKHIFIDEIRNEKLNKLGI